MSTIFSRIIAGEIPSYKIYENEYVYAFLDINPINLGHTLVVPKVEVDYFIDLEEPYYGALFQAAKKISRALQNATNCKRVGTIIAGRDVPHVHYHLVPMFAYNDLDPSKGMKRTDEEMKDMQSKIIENL